MATRILYVITKANWGGAQRYVYDLATTAKERKYEVAVAYGETGELAERLKAMNIATFQIDGLGRDIRLWNDITAFFSLIRIMRTYTPTVVHLNSSKVGGIGALAARFTKVPKIIFTAHAWAFNEARPRYQKVAITFLAWLTVVLSKRTIVVSSEMKRQTSRWPFVKNKIKAITNGTRKYELLGKNEARAALAALHPALSISDLAHDPWIGTVAELHPVKGLSYALGAVSELRKKHPTIRYLILSDGHLRAELEAQIMQLHLEQNVFLLGHVKDAPRYGRAYDVFLLPSLSEAFGISILEAGLASLPTVATRVGGIPEIITSGETGLLVPSRDAHAISIAIDSLLSDAPLRERVGDALAHCVATEFTLERVLRDTFALY